MTQVSDRIPPVSLRTRYIEVKLVPYQTGPTNGKNKQDNNPIQNHLLPWSML
jgi:hypothetical protein